MSVQCVSTILFHGYIEEGEAELRRQVLGSMDRLIQVSRALGPRFVRLLGARTRQPAETRALLLSRDPKLDWLFALYREAIDRLAAAGLSVTIENETNGCILCDGDTVRAFFERLDRSGRAVFTWDVQNMWHCGAFPSLAIYEQIKPFLAYYHVKGGQSEPGGQALRYKSTLEDASWPVLSITRKVVSDGSARSSASTHRTAKRGRATTKLTRPSAIWRFCAGRSVSQNRKFDSQNAVVRPVLREARCESMALTFNEASLGGRHHLSYRILDAMRSFPVREVEVLATPRGDRELRAGWLPRP